MTRRIAAIECGREKTSGVSAIGVDTDKALNFINAVIAMVSWLENCRPVSFTHFSAGLQGRRC